MNEDPLDISPLEATTNLSVPLVTSETLPGHRKALKLGMQRRMQRSEDSHETAREYLDVALQKLEEERNKLDAMVEAFRSGAIGSGKVE